MEFFHSLIFLIRSILFADLVIKSSALTKMLFTFSEDNHILNSRRTLKYKQMSLFGNLKKMKNKIVFSEVFMCPKSHVQKRISS